MSTDDELEELLRSSGIEINEETQEQVVEKVAEPKKEIKLIEDDIPFGYFCFEVHSG